MVRKFPLAFAKLGRGEYPWRRSLAAALFLLAGLLGLPGPALADRRSDQTYVEAEYLVNFLRYTQWPERCFESADSPWVISVVGPVEVADRVGDVAAAAGKVSGRPIVVLSIPFQRASLNSPLRSERDRQALARMRGSHLVFFHGDANPLHPNAITDLWGRPILTVSDNPGFTASGGMLGLFKSSGRIVFEANPGAIRNSGLMVSAKVLKLARVAARTRP